MLKNPSIPVHSDLVFPYGAYITSDEIEPITEFTAGVRGAQAKDPLTGELMWSVTVHDADPEAKGPAQSVKVKIASPVQPQLPPNLPGLPTGLTMRPVEFDGLTVKPYCTEVMQGRFKVAYSLTARAMRAPAPASASNGSARSGKDAATV